MTEKQLTNIVTRFGSLLSTLGKAIYFDRRRHRRSHRSRQQTRISESLEQRTLLTGNVNAVLNGSNVQITGDAAGNSVEIVVTGDSVVVRGLDSTAINGLAEPFTITSTSSTIAGNLQVAMGGGNDSLIIGPGVAVAGRTSISGNGGNDTIGIMQSTLQSQLSIDGGSGSNSIVVQDSSVSGMTHLVSSGSALISLKNAELAGALTVETGSGNDDLVISGSTVQGPTRILTDSGDDDIVLQQSTLSHSLYVNAGRGGDIVWMDDVTVAGKTSLWMRQGNDSIQIGGSSSFSGRTLVGAVLGRDALEIDSEVSISKLRKPGRPSAGVSETLIDARITGSNGAISRATTLASQFLPLLTVSINADSISEAAGTTAAQMTITRSGSTTSELTVNLTSSHPNRARSAATAVIPAGQTSVTVPIEAVDNATIDPATIVTFTASTMGFRTGTDVVTITDEESSLLMISAPSATISESAEQASRTLTVTRTSPDVSQPLTVSLTSGTPGRLSLPATVVIPANAASATFVVTVANDLVDGNVSVPITATAEAHATGQLTIAVNDDDTAFLSVAPATTTVDEDDDSGVQLTVSRNTADTSQPLLVTLSSSSARLPLDVPSITIPAGQMSATLIVAPTDNSVADGNVSVAITAESDGFADGTSSVTVVDDESPLLSITPAAPTFAEDAAGAARTLTISRSNSDLTQPLNVNLSLASIARATFAGGSPTFTAVIPANQSSVTVVIDAIDNTVVDGTGATQLTASATGFQNTVITVSVTDNDVPELGLSPVTSTLSEATATGVVLTVSRNTADTSQALLVTLTPSSSADSRVTVPATVTIPVGAMTADFTVVPVQNSVANDTVEIVITAQAGGFATDTANISLTDDDSVSPTLSITPVDAEMSEGANEGERTLTITRNDAELTQPLTVNLTLNSTTRVSFTGNTATTTLVIPANQASATVLLIVDDNTVIDGTAVVALTASAQGFSNSDVQISINDNDVPTLTVTPETFTVDENSSSGVTLTVTRNTADTTAPLEVTLSPGPSTSDRLTTPATVTIPAGQTFVTFAAMPTDNDIDDGDISVSVTASTSGFTAGTASITVLDDDVLPALLTITPVAPSFSESADTASRTVTITRSQATLSEPLTVELTLDAADRMSFSNDAATISVIIPANETSATTVIVAINNAIVDGDSTTALTATASGFTETSVTVTVTDDDVAGLTIVPLQNSLSEDNASGIQLTVSRNTLDNSEALLVNLTPGASGSARLVTPETVTIPSGQSSVSFAATPVSNETFEGNVAVIVSSGAAGFASGEALVLVVDDESPVLTITPQFETVQESEGSVNATVSIESPTSSDLTVLLSYESPDVLTGPASVVIPEGQSSVDVTLSIIDGSVFDGTFVARFAGGFQNSNTAYIATINVEDVDNFGVTVDTSSNTTVQSNGALITRDELFTVTGTTQSLASIVVDSDGDGLFDDAFAQANPNGSFTFDVTLAHTATNKGANRIRIRAEDGPTFGDTAFDVHYALGTVIRFETNAGTFDAELLDTDAPVTVANFKSYEASAALNNLIVHRSMENFIVQAGGFTVSGGQISDVVEQPPIANEFLAANSNVRGTLSMALVPDAADSGTSQWFINLGNNSFLDADLHTVFGRIIGSGMTVVDQIAAIPVRDLSSLYSSASLTDVPLRDPAPTGTFLTGTVAQSAGSALIQGTGTQFTTELQVGSSVRIGSTLYFVESIQSDTELTVDSVAPGSAQNLTVQKDVVPDDADFVVFSNIHEILQLI
jgi:cyclophilin family peptidyl-prolyl cis-trans isomerase